MCAADGLDNQQMRSSEVHALDSTSLFEGIGHWHRMLCGESSQPMLTKEGDISLINSRILPQFGSGTLDIASFDDELIVVGMRCRFDRDLSYHGVGEGWTRLHFRKAARTLMQFEGHACSELEGPLCQVLHQPVGLPDEEWIEGGVAFDWVTVFMRPRLLTERFRLDSIGLTDPLRRLAQGADDFVLENWSLSAEMALAMNQLLGERYAGDLRRVHLEAKATELVCMMSKVLRPCSQSESTVRLLPRDVDALHEVRRILAQTPAGKPSIQALSRRVGINRNKLTFGFKHLFEQTISEYRLELRLQLGWKLLQETSLPIAVVADRVGYGQAAAFSTAFRQHFGITPRHVRLRK